MRLEADPGHSRRFWLWEIGGGALVFLVLVLFVGLMVMVITWHSEEVEQAKRIAEANRPVDAVNVALLRLQRIEVQDQIILPGLLQPWKVSNLSAQVSGRVVSKLAEGTKVSKDEVILRIDDSDYIIKLEDAKAKFAEAEQSYKRKEKLHSSRVNPLSVLEEAAALYSKAKSELQTAQLALERCQITAPFDGVVDIVTPEIGELVNVGATVATIAQLGDLKAEVGIPEKDIDLVRDITTCEVEVEAARTTVIGERTYLSYLPAPEAQVYVLRLRLPNQDGILRPGMFGNARVVREVRQNIMVPIYTVLTKDDTYYVFVAGDYTLPEDKKHDPRKLQSAVRRNVKLGVVKGADVEILEGLEPGDRLVAVGQRNLDEGTVINVVKEVGSMAELQN